MKSSLNDEERQSVITELQNTENVNNVVETFIVADTANHNEYSEDLQVVVPSNAEELKNVITINDLANKKEEVSLSSDGVILTDKLAQLLDVKVGDTITLKDSDGNEIASGTREELENQGYTEELIKENSYEETSEKTNKDIKMIEQDTERDHYLSAKEALEYGIVDKIL